MTRASGEPSATGEAATKDQSSEGSAAPEAATRRPLGGARAPQPPGSCDGLYEASFAPSTAAYARLGRAIIEHHGKLVDSSRLFPNDVTILVRLRLSHVEDFFAMLKAYEWRYRSPTIFDGHGSLIARYASAVDEAAGRMTDVAKIVIDRLERKCRSCDAEPRGIGDPVRHERWCTA